MIAKLLGFLKKSIFVLWLCLIAILAAWIATDNPQPFSLTLFVFSFPELSVGVYLCLILAVGVVLGFSTSYLLLRSTLYVKNRKLKKVEQRIGRLKNTPQKGALSAAIKDS